MKSIQKYIPLIIFVMMMASFFTPTSAQTITITHELGTTEVPAHPQKIVVFDFGVLESLDHLGVPVVALPQTSLPPHLSTYASAQYQNVGSLVEPDFEAIAEINPELIFISGRQSAHYDELSRIAPTIYMGIDNANYLRSFERNIKILGSIFGLEDAVEQEIASIRNSIDRVKELSAGQRTLVTLVTGGKANAYGPGSRYGFVYDVLGLEPVDKSIVSSTHGQNISFEYILVNDPDYILVIDRDAVVGGGGAQTAKQVIENALVRETKAFKNGHIAYLNPYYWYISGGGLTSFSRMVSDIETLLK